jgi:hypothetical protein
MNGNIRKTIISFFKKIKENIREYPKGFMSVVLVSLLIVIIVFILPRSKDWGIGLALIFIETLFLLYVVDFLLTLRERADREVLVRDVTEHLTPTINDAISKVLMFFTLKTDGKEPVKVLEEFLTEDIENKLKRFDERNLRDYLELIKSLGTNLSIYAFSYESYLRPNILIKLRNFQENIGKLEFIIENYFDLKNEKNIRIENYFIKSAKEELEILLYLGENIPYLVK